MSKRWPKATRALKFSVGPFEGMDPDDWAMIQGQITLAIQEILADYLKSERVRPSFERLSK